MSLRARLCELAVLATLLLSAAWSCNQEKPTESAGNTPVVNGAVASGERGFCPADSLLMPGALQSYDRLSCEEFSEKVEAGTERATMLDTQDCCECRLCPVGYVPEERTKLPCKEYMELMKESEPGRCPDLDHGVVSMCCDVQEVDPMEACKGLPEGQGCLGDDTCDALNTGGQCCLFDGCTPKTPDRVGMSVTLPGNTPYTCGELASLMADYFEPEGELCRKFQDGYSDICEGNFILFGGTTPMNLADVWCGPERDYHEMLAQCRAEISEALPLLDSVQTDAFMEAHRAEAPEDQVLPHSGYDNLEAVQHTLSLARPIWEDPALEQFLADESLEKTLVKCAVLANALPAGLEEFSAQGDEEQRLVDELLGNHEMMKQMLVAGGAKAGRYGPAMQILKNIQNASGRARSGLFLRLAVATSLELAAPDLVANYADIEPVSRYLFYERSYLDGELIDQFADFSTWEYRNVINSWSTEEDLAWLREMLRNYLPDWIGRASDEDRFIGIQSEDRAIPQKLVEYDETLPYTRTQQILATGGQCGAKAVFGRSLMRSFGVPVWGITMTGHAAIGYWSPSGWRDNLGGTWENGFWKNDVTWIAARIHLLDAQARAVPDEYLKALRLEWVGDILGEEDIDLMWAGRGDLWSALALNKKRAIVKDDYVRPPATGAGSGQPEPTAEEKRIFAGDSGVITIPAVSCVNSNRQQYPCNKESNTNYADKIKFIENEDGEKLLHYKRWEKIESFDYLVDVPRAGRYALTADVVTINMDQSFSLTVNAAVSPIKVELPYTVGMWGTSKPVEVSLVQGQNTLRFTRNNPYPEGSYLWYCNNHNDPDCGGITVRSFKLTPVQ